MMIIMITIIRSTSTTIVFHDDYASNDSRKRKANCNEKTTCLLPRCDTK